MLICQRVWVMEEENRMTVNENDKIAYFRRELCSYKYYLASIEDIDNKIEAIDVELNGVSSPNLTDIPAHSRSAETITYRIMELWEEQSRLQKQKLFYEERVRDIRSKLDMLDEEERKMLIDIYINEIGFSNAGSKYSMARSPLFRKVNQIIAKII